MMNDTDLVSLTKRLVRAAENHRDEMAKERSDATDYYNGKVPDLPAMAGRSTMVSKDVRSAVKKVLPSVMRTLLGSPEVFEYLPREQDDEEGAEQSSQYINHVVFKEARGKEAVHAAVHDAMLLRSGVVKAWWRETASVSISKHSGLGEEALAELVGSDDVEVVEQDVTEEMVEQIDPMTGEQAMMPVPSYSVKIRRRKVDARIAIAAVPLDQFILDPDAVDLNEAIIVGQCERLRRGDLVAMGYDRKMVDDLPIAGKEGDELEEARDERVERDEVDDRGEALNATALQEIDYYDLFVRADRDGDGINELLRMTFAGGLGIDNLLDVEDWDHQPFVDFVVERQPHQQQGASIADDVMDIQKVKTALLRATLDNLYWQNRPQPIMQEGMIENEDAVYSPGFGKPIRVKAGMSVKDVLGFNQVPLVAADSFNMLGYFDEALQDRTGISDASSGMAPDALQNMTAKASAMMEAAGIGQTEMMVKTLADGLAKLGSLILRLTIQHQDRPRTVRLRGEWVEYDPRSWNADMDVEVNTGLGAGSRERDLMVVAMLKDIQAELLQAFGPDNPFVTPKNLWNMLVKTCEAMGLASAETFFTEPDEEQVKAKIDQQASQPSPEEQKLKGQMQIEQMKAQAQQAKEKAQMEADLYVKEAEMAASTQAAAEKMQVDRQNADEKLAIERERMAQERELRVMEMAQARELELIRIEADQQKAEAASVGDALREVAANDKNTMEAA